MSRSEVGIKGPQNVVLEPVSQQPQRPVEYLPRPDTSCVRSVCQSSAPATLDAWLLTALVAVAAGHEAPPVARGFGEHALEARAGAEVLVGGHGNTSGP